MENKISTFNKYCDYSLIFSTISSLSILFYAFMGINSTFDRIIKYFFPLVFWVFLVCEQVFIWNANAIRKSIEKDDSKEKFRGKVGIFTFFKSKLAMIFDYIMIGCIVILLIFTIFDMTNPHIQYIVISALILSFRYHCILNGRNYRYKKYLTKKMEETNVK